MFKKKQRGLLKVIIHLLVLGIIMSPALSFLTGTNNRPVSLFYFSITNISLLFFLCSQCDLANPKFYPKKQVPAIHPFFAGVYGCFHLASPLF